MKVVKSSKAVNADDREALRDLVRLLARLTAAEYVRATLQPGLDGSYDEPRGRS